MSVVQTIGPGLSVPPCRMTGLGLGSATRCANPVPKKGVPPVRGIGGTPRVQADGTV